MTEKILAKISGTIFEEELNRLKAERKMLENDTNRYLQADKTQREIHGYLKAMRDAGIITDRERGILYIYFATV